MALAPDDQVAKAALARPGKWQRAGREDETLWAEHLGSGEAPYQVAVDLDGPAFECTCPSRKRPCKHALGLFFLAQAEPGALPPAMPPAWVHERRAGRAASWAGGQGINVAG